MPIALFVLFFFSHANAFHGKMENVSIAQCGIRACTTVSASSADVGWLSTNLNLQRANLVVRQKDGKSETFNAAEIFYDHSAQRIYLHGVAELKNAEAFYDLKSEKLTVF